MWKNCLCGCWPYYDHANSHMSVFTGVDTLAPAVGTKLVSVCHYKQYCRKHLWVIGKNFVVDKF